MEDGDSDIVPGERRCLNCSLNQAAWLSLLQMGVSRVPFSKGQSLGDGGSNPLALDRSYGSHGSHWSDEEWSGVTGENGYGDPMIAQIASFVRNLFYIR